MVGGIGVSTGASVWGVLVGEHGGGVEIKSVGVVRDNPLIWRHSEVLVPLFCEVGGWLVLPAVWTVAAQPADEGCNDEEGYEAGDGCLPDQVDEDDSNYAAGEKRNDSQSDDR